MMLFGLLCLAGCGKASNTYAVADPAVMARQGTHGLLTCMSMTCDSSREYCLVTQIGGAIPGEGNVQVLSSGCVEYPVGARSCEALEQDARSERSVGSFCGSNGITQLCQVSGSKYTVTCALN